MFHRIAILSTFLLIIFASVATSMAAPLSADAERAPKPKDSFKDCDVCPEMVVVPAGSFFMGAQPEAPDAPTYLIPERITFAEPFAVGRFAVTFEEWDACVADGGCGGYRPGDEGWGRGRQPVIHVSFDDAKAYVAWLSRKTGKSYRLLTDAEREYVTRAGTITTYWWGPTITPDQANYNDDYYSPSTTYRRKTVPVDSFKPNPWGLYQVHGNVWEWVDNCQIDAIHYARNCELRGGSWASKAWELAADDALWTDPRFQGIVGFRVMRALEQ
jgi:formylglycine-generating enzyme required for sulfatase activity